MSISNETRCLQNDIIVKSLKCSQLISFLRSHHDLGQ